LFKPAIQIGIKTPVNLLTIRRTRQLDTLDSCRINIKDLTDINGNVLNKRRDQVLRQFRELFVQEYYKPVGFKNICFIESLPLRQNCISHSGNVARYWMNTPLRSTEKL
jgi:hypothetical protein